MCGIVGLFKRKELPRRLTLARDMSDRIAHRGPDGSGVVAFDGSTVIRTVDSTQWQAALAHNRLAVIDLNGDAAQPMVYRDRLWIAHNGEVYNYVELRTELERRGHSFRTDTDAEVVLAAFDQWGPLCFQHMRGMWALIIVDLLGRTAVLCRDRLGMKPLYTWNGDGMLAVVSEIKQLMGAPGFHPRHSEEAVSEFLATGYEDPSRTFFRDVSPVSPGTYQTLALDTATSSAPRPYWWPDRVKIEVYDIAEAAGRFASKLDESVELHLRSDVPVGCAVSGGLDSSSIAVLAGRRFGTSERLHTFTASCIGDPAEERQYVDAVLERIDAAFHFVSLSADGFKEDLDKFVWHHDEPVASASMYASYCVARLAHHSKVPVILHGEGGDEILSGYWQSYFIYLRELGLGGRMFTLAGHFAGALLADGNSSLLGQVPIMLQRYLARRRGIPSARGGPAASSAVLRRVLTGRGQARRINELRVMHLPRLLRWGDRNSMAFSVEGRYPFLDHELVELCLSFADEILYHRGWTKWPLRRGLGAALPEKVVHRRSKFGFWVPQDLWLCGPLRSTLTQWLASDRPLWELVDPAIVGNLAEETWRSPAGRQEPGQALVRCFMLDRWLEVFDVA